MCMTTILQPWKYLGLWPLSVINISIRKLKCFAKIHIKVTFSVFQLTNKGNDKCYITIKFVRKLVKTSNRIGLCEIIRDARSRRITRTLWQGKSGPGNWHTFSAVGDASKQTHVDQHSTCKIYYFYIGATY